MGRENKNEAVAALHRQKIMTAAEQLFLQKGYEDTTIEDISKLSGYSRRTIYAYFDSKEDILQYIVEKGLLFLKEEVEKAVNSDDGFLSRYMSVCAAIYTYQEKCPCSQECVRKADSAILKGASLSETAKSILRLGTEINCILADFMEKGKEEGVIRSDVDSMLTTLILFSSISSVHNLAHTKGVFFRDQFSLSEEELIEYAFKQMLNGIRKEKI